MTEKGADPRGRVVVVGAGIAGAACARELAAAGVPVRVVDRGHRPGGRMASRRLSERPVDLGASYLTVSGPDFAAVVAEFGELRACVHIWSMVLTPMDVRVEIKQGGIKVQLCNASRQISHTEDATPCGVPCLVGFAEFVHLIQLFRGR